MEKPISDNGLCQNRGRKTLKKGLYDPALEHDGCGVGFITRLDGKSTHAIVRQGIDVLIHLEHRGALGGDMITGDGAGLMTQIPDAFFRAEAPQQLPEFGGYALGMVFPLLIHS